MKNFKTTFLFLCLCICMLNSHAQNSVLFDEIQKAKSAGEKFEPVIALSFASKSASQSQKFEEHYINPQEVYVLQYSKPDAKHLNASIALPIPLGNRSLMLELLEFEMEYSVKTSSGQTFPQNKNIRHYHGIVKDDPHSIVAITFAEDKIIGLVATDEGNLMLAFDKQSGAHLFYNDKNIKDKPGFFCGTPTDSYADVYSPEVLFQNTRSYVVNQRPVKLYYETTYDIYQALGYSRGNVETFVTALYNQVAVLFRNEYISTTFASPEIAVTPCQFTGLALLNTMQQNLKLYLEVFQKIRTSFDGDLGQLLTLRNLGITSPAGIAPGHDGLGNSNVARRLSVVQLPDVNGVPNVPAFSLSVLLSTHEFGHLFGSRHTHDCVWNGNNTAIDGCAPAYGSCSTPPIPSNGGTIMSYCHLQSVNVNFNLGFGPQPGNVIRDRVINPVSISGPSSTPNGQYATYYAIKTSNDTPVASYEWILNPKLNNNLYGASSSVLDIAFYTAGYYQLVCRAYNACGWGPYTTKNIEVFSKGSYSLPYPNPVSDMLTVSFNPESVEEAKSSLQASGSGQRSFSLDIKLLDLFGVVLRQATSSGENITIDVSGLKNGMYVLQVHDGITAEPEVHKIVVNH